MDVIFLIGFMGSGKSTLGKALGLATDWKYIDLDDAMEHRQGLSVSDIFATHGEQWFRAEESRLLRELASDESARVIIGCGGGTPCHSGNMEWMNSRGTTVLLRASDEALLRRLLEAQDSRPLLRGLSPDELRRFISSKQLEREPHYGKAALTICSDRLESPAEIAETVEAFRRLTGI